MVEAEHSTESLPSFYSASATDTGTRTLQQQILQSLMTTFFVVMRHVVRERAFQRESAEKIMRPLHSSFTDRTDLSAYAFKFGDRGGSLIASTRSRASAARKVAEYFVSRSMIKNRVP